MIQAGSGGPAGGRLPGGSGLPSPSAFFGSVAAGRGGARTMTLGFDDETGRLPVDVLA